MGRKYHRAVVGNFVQFVHEHRTLLLQGFDHELVVDDFVAHIDGGPVQLDGAFDDMNGPVHSGAEAAGTGKDDGQRNHIPVLLIK